jgi:dTMP kinase
VSGGFITFEGGEGAGKTTQLSLLEQAFQEAGIDYVRTREPGGTPGAEQIRELIVTGDAGRWSAETETLLLMAARRDHAEKVILPALAAGKWVLCDRWLDSTLVYQGITKKLGMAWVDQLYRLVFGSLQPDLTFYLDIEPQKGLHRTQNRDHGNETRFEDMDSGFHLAVRNGFLALSATSERYVRVDADAEETEVQASILSELNKRFNLLK